MKPMKFLKGLSPFSSKSKSQKQDTQGCIKDQQEKDKKQSRSSEMYKQIEGLVDQLAGMFHFKSDKKKKIIDGLAETSMNKGSLCEDDIFEMLDIVENQENTSEKQPQLKDKQQNLQSLPQLQMPEKTQSCPQVIYKKTTWKQSIMNFNMSSLISKFKLGKSSKSIIFNSKQRKNSLTLEGIKEDQSTKSSKNPKGKKYGELHDQETVLEATMSNMKKESFNTEDFGDDDDDV